MSELGEGGPGPLIYCINISSLTPSELRSQATSPSPSPSTCTTILSRLHLYMAACGFGASGLKTTNLDLGSLRPKLSTFQALSCVRTRKFVQVDGLVFSRRSRKAVIGCQSSTSEADSAANSEDNSEITKSSGAASPHIPNSLEVESLLAVLCDTTSIAEFELKLGGFRLYVSRNLVEQTAPPSRPSLPAPVLAHSVVETPPDSNGSALALSKPVPSLTGVQTLLDKAADEGLVILHSPKVGYFRRSRTVKGKRVPSSCKEKDTVKEGQVLCYIDQLGGEIPIESDTSGEVVKILREDGDPVGYGDALIAILPSFPGIKKLQ